MHINKSESHDTKPPSNIFIIVSPSRFGQWGGGGGYFVFHVLCWEVSGG
jgi:hypothetical protein